MANVNIKFNNKDYLLSCDDGQEESLKQLTKFLDKKYSELKDKLGNIGENKLLLITTIQLIDEYFDLKHKVSKQKKKLDEKKILKILKFEKINLICLAGFMKILSKSFIKNFKGKILNIHPSLLPKYKGLNTHKRVLLNKEKYTGCTVHFVSPNLDSGKIIMQKKIKVKKKDTPEKLGKRVLIEEHKLYPRAILKIFNL